VSQKTSPLGRHNGNFSLYYQF